MWTHTHTHTHQSQRVTENGFNGTCWRASRSCSVGGALLINCDADAFFINCTGVNSTWNIHVMQKHCFLLIVMLMRFLYFFALFSPLAAQEWTAHKNMSFFDIIQSATLHRKKIDRHRHTKRFKGTPRVQSCSYWTACIMPRPRN